MKVSSIKLYRTRVDILADSKMKINVTKAQEENRKIVLDFYNYFNTEDRFILEFVDVNIFADTGLIINDIEYSDNRNVSFKVSGGLPENSYDVDVIVVLNDGQTWKSRLSFFIGFETGVM